MSNQTIDMVARLIESCRDGHEGYRAAAERTQNSELKDFFTRQSLERARFAEELETVTRYLGKGDPSGISGMAKQLRCRWFDQTQTPGDGDVSILEMVDTGEGSVKKQYQDVLRAELPIDVRGIIETQIQSVFAAHNKVCALRDQLKIAA